MVISCLLFIYLSFTARYTYCCHGIHCPNCSLTVEFRVFDKVYDVSRSLKTACEEHLFSVQLDAVVQPGIHKMEVCPTVLNRQIDLFSFGHVIFPFKTTFHFLVKNFFDS